MEPHHLDNKVFSYPQAPTGQNHDFLLNEKTIVPVFLLCQGTPSPGRHYRLRFLPKGARAVRGIEDLGKGEGEGDVYLFGGVREDGLYTFTKCRRVGTEWIPEEQIRCYLGPVLGKPRTNHLYELTFVCHQNVVIQMTEEV